MLTILTTPSLALSHTLPIGRFVTTTRKTSSFNKRFQPIQAMAILHFPIPVDAFGNLAQDMAG